MRRPCAQLTIPHSTVKDQSVLTVQIFDQRKFKRKVRFARRPRPDDVLGGGSGLVLALSGPNYPNHPPFPSHISHPSFLRTLHTRSRFDMLTPCLQQDQGFLGVINIKVSDVLDLELGGQGECWNPIRACAREFVRKRRGRSRERQKRQNTVSQKRGENAVAA